MQTSLAVDDVKKVRERAELKHVALQVRPMIIAEYAYYCNAHLL
jgi:hypothetical protein